MRKRPPPLGRAAKGIFLCVLVLSVAGCEFALYHRRPVCAEEPLPEIVIRSIQEKHQTVAPELIALIIKEFLSGLGNLGGDADEVWFLWWRQP